MKCTFFANLIPGIVESSLCYLCYTLMLSMNCTICEVLLRKALGTFVSNWVLQSECCSLELCFCPSIAKTLHATSAYKMQFSLSYDTVNIKFLLIFLLSYQRFQFNLQSNIMISSIRLTFMRHGNKLEFMRHKLINYTWYWVNNLL